MKFSDFISSNPGSMPPPQVIDQSGDAIPGIMNFVDTSGGPITLNLPVSPVIGTTVSFNDYTSSFDINTLTVNGGTQKIMGLSEPLNADTKHITFHLTYSGLEHGWRLT